MKHLSYTTMALLIPLACFHAAFANPTIPLDKLKNVLADATAHNAVKYPLNVHLYPSPTAHDAPVLLCMHGYGGSAEDASILRHNNCVNNYHIVSFDFPDANLTQGRKSAGNTTFGSIDELLPVYTLLHHLTTSGNLTAVHLYGFSAGGAAAVNTLSVLTTGRYTEELAKIGISAPQKTKILNAISAGSVILDCPLKSVEEIIAVRSLDTNLSVIAARYAKNQLRPIEAVATLTNTPFKIFLYFEEHDEILSNRDDALFYEHLKNAIHPQGSLVYIRAHQGGHNALPHTQLWKAYKQAMAQ